MSAVQPFPQSIEYWLPVIEDAVGGYHIIELLETRLSWLYMTTQHVYKIKKPLDIGDSHNWSEAHRKQACLDEVRLNERLAPGVYLGVVPIVEEPNGAVRLNGRGIPIEYAIKMRRLHEDRNLGYLIEHGALRNEHVQSLGRTLAAFYKSLPPDSIDVAVYCRRLIRRILESGNLLMSAADSQWQRKLDNINTVLQRFVEQSLLLLASRVCDGRIVDGHGDLRAAHVFFERQPLIIDCAEYSARIRAVDALDDLAGLAVDCEHLARADVAAQLMAQYRREAADEAPLAVEAFYKSLHAVSRASERLESYRRNGKAVVFDSTVISWMDLAERHSNLLV